MAKNVSFVINKAKTSPITKNIMGAGIALFFLLIVTSIAQAEHNLKAILGWWPQAEISDLEQNYKIMDSKGFDGVILQNIFRVATTDQDLTYFIFNPADKTFWNEDWRQKSERASSIIKNFVNLKDNFLRVNLNAKQANGGQALIYSLFDDAQWENALINMATAARIVKNSGLIGIFMDVECYDSGHFLLDYNKLLEQDRQQHIDADDRGSREGFRIHQGKRPAI